MCRIHSLSLQNFFILFTNKQTKNKIKCIAFLLSARGFCFLVDKLYKIKLKLNITKYLNNDFNFWFLIPSIYNSNKITRPKIWTNWCGREGKCRFYWKNGDFKKLNLSKTKILKRIESGRYRPNNILCRYGDQIRIIRIWPHFNYKRSYPLSFNETL